MFFFFFQAEDGIRDRTVTGVQTCALPILFSSIRLGSGPLSVIDLYQLRLSAELVTLSGCSTGLNAIVGGDELLGLARGLLYAGARAVLLTLWDAYDMSTSEFMASFYRHLLASSNKAQ